MYGYDANGSTTDRWTYDLTTFPAVQTGEDHFGYSYRGLNWRYISGDPGTNNHTDWRYRYNAMGEREQKRMYQYPIGDNVPYKARPWIYYLLGGQKEQLSVWAGQQTSLAGCDTNGRRVYMYPTEYITTGVGYTGVQEDITPIITKPDGTKEYRIHDHLASLRISLENGTFQATDYSPWGELLSGVATSRRGFNDREADKESGNVDLGVRKLDSERGAMTSIDPLWEKFPQVSPYIYGNNNPMRYTDPDGMQAKKTFLMDDFNWTIATPQQLFLFQGAVFHSNATDAEDVTTAMAYGSLRVIPVKGYGDVTIGSPPSSASGTTTGDMASRRDISGQTVGGPLDAVRHALACAWTARMIGYKATVGLGDSHEGGAGDAESVQDRFNNRVGARIGALHQDASDEEIFNLVMEAFKNGELQLHSNPKYGDIRRLKEATLPEDKDIPSN